MITNHQNKSNQFLDESFLIFLIQLSVSWYINPNALKDLIMDKEKLEWVKEGLRDSHNEEKKIREEII